MKILKPIIFYFEIIFFIYIFNYYKNYILCMKCIENNNNSTYCFHCPVELIFKGLKILSDDKTLDEIIFNKKSISRFGDGEFHLIFEKTIGFQKANKLLSRKLLEVLNCKDKNFLVGINIPYKELTKVTTHVKRYWTKYFNNYKFKLAKIINKKKLYYSATISRFYVRYKDKTNIPNYIQKLKKIWDKRNILIIEGEKSRIGIGNDLFDNVKSIKRIICPFRNAFNVYNKILNEVLKIKEKRLILIALGPTATILAYDLYKLGYQSIDIGHMDIEYEWFLKNTTKKIQIKNKYVNEALGNRNIFTKVKDNNYYKEIIVKILNY